MLSLPSIPAVLTPWLHAMETPKDRLFMFTPDDVQTGDGGPGCAGIRYAGGAVEKCQQVATAHEDGQIGLSPIRPRPGSLIAGRRRSRPSTAPNRFSSMPSTQPSVSPR
jgi:hypothetical protein